MSQRQEELIQLIMDNDEPEMAVDVLLSFYDDLYNQAKAIYSYWSSIRQAICRRQQYANPDYQPLVMELYRECSVEDQERLRTLLQSELFEKHRIYIQKKPFLWNRMHDAQLKRIPPVQEQLYRFRLPPEILEYRTQLMMKRDLEQQHHQRSLLYHLTTQEAEDIIEHCIAILHSDLVTIKDYYDNVVALQILSGRRNYEVLQTLSWFPASHSYQANVSGIAKKRSIGDNDEVFTIPLLCTYDLFSASMQRLRDARDIEGTCQDINSLTSARILSASKRVAGMYLGHSQKRNIYSEMAWKKRSTENHYLVGSQSCSKNIWIQNALCHDFAITCTNRYQTMIIE